MPVPLLTRDAEGLSAMMGTKDRAFAPSAS
jgi:hypothetical protein